MLFGKKILDYWDEIISDLTKVIAIPSVSISQEGAHPFGEDCAEVIDSVMEMAGNYGLSAKNVDYYAMHAEYGEGEENAVVMAHLDVVPAGEGWENPAYELTQKGGKLIGRGTGDNKGPAIVALHCLRALKDAGVAGKRKIRVVLGVSEETGMEDMRYYFSKEQLPTMGFTPDASYGICNCEKGLFSYTAEGSNDSAVVKSFKAGTVPNAVPYKAECKVICTDEEFSALKANAEKLEGDFIITQTECGAEILSKGKAAHASTPQEGFNAASYLVELLFSVFSSEKMGAFFSYINDKIGTAHDGSLMGVKMSDEESGSLTFNLGIVECNEAKCSLTVDIRYPATKKGADINAIIKKATIDAGLNYTLKHDTAPLYLPKDSAFIRLLKGAYEDTTGKPCEIFSMGGGTYAREMKGHGVAFGAGFPDNPDGEAHTANEFVWEENLKLHAQICLEAMYRMLTME